MGKVVASSESASSGYSPDNRQLTRNFVGNNLIRVYKTLIGKKNCVVLNRAKSLQNRVLFFLFRV